MKLKTVLLSPLVHFFGIGAAIFVLFGYLNDEPAAPPENQIALTEAAAGRLVDQFAATWNRPPTEEELQGLMLTWAQDEAYKREALALGLDQGDAVIRQRLIVKMRFLADSGASSLVPNDADLQAYLDANRDLFQIPAKAAFSQIFLASDTQEETTAILASLERGMDPAELGEANLLPKSIPLTSAHVIDSQFGPGFHAGIADLPLNQWQGPVKSTYGWHLVKIAERTGAKLPELSDIRDKVEGEWRREKVMEMRAAFGKALLERYTVILPSSAEVLNR